MHISKIISYRTVNTLRAGYKNHSVKTVGKSNCCFY